MAAGVLIESDWNLKWKNLFRENELLIGINRIRLEFKVYYVEERADV